MKQKNRHIRTIAACAGCAAAIVLCGLFRTAEEATVYATMGLNLLLIGCMRMSRRARVGNLLAFGAYNLPLLYCLHCKGAGGASFTWLFGLFLFNGLHALGLTTGAAIRKIRNRRQKSSR